MGKFLSKIRSKRGKEKLKKTPKSLWDIEISTLSGEKVRLREYRKKKKLFLFVNIASSCCLTGINFRQLNHLYSQLKNSGLEILAFHCFQFSGSNSFCSADIEEMLKNKFKPEFNVFEKIEVNGENTHPIYRYLRKMSREYFTSEESYGNEESEVKYIPWNFAKFLVDRHGNVVRYYTPTTFPKRFLEEIQALLNNM